jgi:hypothetical protein
MATAGYPAGAFGGAVTAEDPLSRVTGLLDEVRQETDPVRLEAILERPCPNCADTPSSPTTW